MIYLYRCPSCGWEGDVNVMVSFRDCVLCDRCGVLIERNMAAEMRSKVLTIPKSLHTSMSDVIGAPGTPHREQWDRDMKAGKIQYAGPGSRWV